MKEADITLIELLKSDVDFCVFDSNDEIESTHDNYGQALNEAVEDSSREVGIMQAGRPVYLDPEGVITKLLQQPVSHTVDIRFTNEGFSASVYTGEGNAVEDEAWFTWDEVEEMKSDEESHITFEL